MSLRKSLRRKDNCLNRFLMQKKVPILENKKCHSKELPFKVLCILYNVPGHPEHKEFNAKGIQVVYFLPNATAVIQPLD